VDFGGVAFSVNCHMTNSYYLNDDLTSSYVRHDMTLRDVTRSCVTHDVETVISSFE